MLQCYALVSTTISPHNVSIALILVNEIDPENIVVCDIDCICPADCSETAYFEENYLFISGSVCRLFRQSGILRRAYDTLFSYKRLSEYLFHNF